MSIASKALMVIAVFALAFLVGRVIGGLFPPRDREDATAPGTAASALPPTSTPAREEAAVARAITGAPTTAPRQAGADPAPTAPRSLADVRQRVIDAEAGLRTGELAAAIDYSDGNNAAVLVRFDLGRPEQAPRLYATTIYTSANQTNKTERIMIGSQSWQRQDNGPWMMTREEIDVAEQVQPFLPLAATSSNPQIVSEADLAVLLWYDARRDTDITLLVDPASGIPRQMRQVARQTGLALVVTYRGWNTPVEITLPQ